MTKNRLLLFVLVVMFCAVAFPQHPHSHGGNPFYWLIVGGLGAIVSYAIYWFFLWLGKSIRGKKSDLINSDDEFEEDTPHITNQLIKNAIDSDTSKSQYKSLSRVSDTRMRKRKILAIVIYLFLILTAVSAIESFILNKRDRLHSDMTEHMKESFNCTKSGESVEALFFKYDKEIEYNEVPIPSLRIIQKDGDSFVESLNETTKRRCENMFSRINHLYKLTSRTWSMCGKIYVPVRRMDGISEMGIQEYGYFPYMIGVPDGFEFNSQIAKTIIEESLKRVYCPPDDYDTVSALLYYENEYFVKGGYIYNDSLPEADIPFDDELTGCEPIYENEHFTGYYWYGLQKIGPYEVFLGYFNHSKWYPEEKHGFNASLKDRVFAYCLVFLILTSALALFLLKSKKKDKASKLILTESLRERLLRYADPIKYVNAANSQRVAAARDISELLLDTALDDSRVEQIADELKEKLGINLITEQEKTYLIDLCKSFIKKKNVKQETKKLVNNLYVLIADLNSISGKDYSEIQRIVSHIIDSQK